MILTRLECFAIGFIVTLVLLVLVGGCAAVQPVVSAGGAVYTHNRINDIDEAADPDRLDSLETRVRNIERRIGLIRRVSQ